MNFVRRQEVGQLLNADTKVCGWGQVIREKAQQAAQSAHEAVKPYLDAAADKTGGAMLKMLLIHYRSPSC